MLKTVTRRRAVNVAADAAVSPTSARNRLWHMVANTDREGFRVSLRQLDGDAEVLEPDARQISDFPVATGHSLQVGVLDQQHDDAPMNEGGRA